MKVAVVGAGISGLYAARRLEASGAEVSVFEASDRLGGRIQTVHHDGLVYEAAAEWILPENLRALNLARSLGFVPIESPTSPNALFYKGQTNPGGSLWEDAALDDQRLKNELDSLLEVLDNPKVTAFQIGRLDNLSLQVLLRSKALSERGAWWLESKLRAEMREDPSRVSAYGYLKQVQRDRKREQSNSAFRIPGGLSGLIAKLAADLKGQVLTGMRLAKTEWKENQVFLTFADGTSQGFDQAVLAMPPAALRLLQFAPAISAKKRAAWEACVYGRAVKICLEFRTNWWSEIGWNGRLMTDRPIQRTWDGTLGSPVVRVTGSSGKSDGSGPMVQASASKSVPDRPSVLTVWICGKAAESWARFSDPVRGALEDLSTHFPQAKEHFVDGTWNALLADAPSGGAYMIPAAGFVLPHTENLAAPEGRVHFASDFWGESAGRIEGALDSAERVVTEVMLS